MEYIFWIAFSLLVGAIASRCNQSFLPWTVLALLLSPLLAGVILAIVCLMKKNG